MVKDLCTVREGEGPEFWGWEEEVNEAFARVGREF